MTTSINHHTINLGTQWLWFLNTVGAVRTTHDEGRDGISMIEFHAPYADSPPMHIHHTEDEAFYVLDGVLRMRVGNADIRIRTGETALAPKGLAHTYVVESLGGARFLNVLTRGDFERFVWAMSRPAPRPVLPTPQGPPTPAQAEALARAAREHGMEFVGPPLEP